MGLIAMSERDLQRIEALSKVTEGRMVFGWADRRVRRQLDQAPGLKPEPLASAGSFAAGVAGRLGARSASSRYCTAHCSSHNWRTSPEGSFRGCPCEAQSRTVQP